MHTFLTSKLLPSFSEKYENHCTPVSHAATACGLFFTAFHGKETRRGNCWQANYGDTIQCIQYSPCAIWQVLGIGQAMPVSQNQ